GAGADVAVRPVVAALIVRDRVAVAGPGGRVHDLDHRPGPGDREAARPEPAGPVRDARRHRLRDLRVDRAADDVARGHAARLRLRADLPVRAHDADAVAAGLLRAARSEPAARAYVVREAAADRESARELHVAAPVHSPVHAPAVPPGPARPGAPHAE